MIKSTQLTVIIGRSLIKLLLNTRQQMNIEKTKHRMIVNLISGTQLIG